MAKLLMTTTKNEDAKMQAMASTVALDPELVKELEELATSEGRNPGDLVRDALRAYLERRRYLVAIDEGIRAADAGEVIEGDAVDSWLQTW